MIDIDNNIKQRGNRRTIACSNSSQKYKIYTTYSVVQIRVEKMTLVQGWVLRQVDVRVTVFWDLTYAVLGGWRVYDSDVNQQCCKVIYSSNDCVGKCKSIDGLHNCQLRLYSQ